MWNEAKFCTTVVHSLVEGYKIPDESGFQYGVKSSIRCFDGIGTLKVNGELHFVCWEAKVLKQMSAFNFNKIREWQNDYLTQYSHAKSVLCYVILGVDCGRGDKRAYIFKWDDLMSQLYHKGFSVHKKELEKLPYNLIKKDVFTFDNIITKETLVSIYGESIYDESNVSVPEVSKDCDKEV